MTTDSLAWRMSESPYQVLRLRRLVDGDDVAATTLLWSSATRPVVESLAVDVELAAHRGEDRDEVDVPDPYLFVAERERTSNVELSSATGRHRRLEVDRLSDAAFARIVGDECARAAADTAATVVVQQVSLRASLTRLPDQLCQTVGNQVSIRDEGVPTDVAIVRDSGHCWLPGPLPGRFLPPIEISMQVAEDHAVLDIAVFCSLWTNADVAGHALVDAWLASLRASGWVDG